MGVLGLLLDVSEVWGFWGLKAWGLWGVLGCSEAVLGLGVGEGEGGHREFLSFGAFKLSRLRGSGGGGGRMRCTTC